MNTIDFSIIIPVKNEQINLRRCFESISNLVYPTEKYELLVIDNGSSDGAVSIAQQFWAIIFICPELTIAGLQNFGAAHSQGRILAFLDVDCTVATDWIRCASRWQNNEGICCFGSPPEVPENATWAQKAWAQIRYKRQEVENVQWLESMNMFIRKDNFERVHGFDEQLATCEDYDLSLRLQSFGRIVANRRIRSLHHGEAATLRQFFHKERWRGVSNISGQYRHCTHWRELPSLLTPLLYILFLVVIVFCLIMLVGTGAKLWLLLLAATLLFWQLPIFAFALWKSRTFKDKLLRLCLFVLLNFYFLARGTSMLLGGRK